MCIRDRSNTISSSLTPEIFREQYSAVVDGPDEWKRLDTSSTLNFAWDRGSTYIQKPPYFDGFSKVPSLRPEITDARVLVYLEDSVTTDHISPAGSIPTKAPAGQFLLGSDVPQHEYNSFGSRRGNHHVMERGTFGNIRLRNKLTPDTEGDWTKHFPTEEVMRIYDASEKYRSEDVPLIVIAGKEYGTGSSRDWAAKGTCLLGVRAVLAETFERIHRSNLIGMGVLPLQFKDGESPKSLGLSGEEEYAVLGLNDDLNPGQDIILRADNREITVICRLDTLVEIEFYKNGGILHTVLRNFMRESLKE